MSRPFRSLGLIGCAALLCAGAAQAAPAFTFNTPDFALPTFAGTGLQGSVWTDVAFPASLGARTVAWTSGWMGSHTADSAFVATTVDYPKGATNTLLDESSTVGQLLGSDAATLTNPGIASHRMLSQNGSTVLGIAMRFGGYYRVDTPGSVLFNVLADDGADLLLQGVQVLLHDGIHAFGGRAGGPVEVAFAQAGLYRLQLDWFDGEHVDGGLLFTSGANGATVAQDRLYQSPLDVPEPGSLPMAAAALLALWLVPAGARRR